MSCPNFPKRYISPDMDNRKRLKSVSSENSGIESSSTAKKSNNPRESITSTDDDPSMKKRKYHIARFFYENGIDIRAINSRSFRNMISLLSGQTKCKIPTLGELKGPIFKDALKQMREYFDKAKSSWAVTGCTILLDDWKDKTGRNLVNILVDCPKATVYLSSYDISEYIGNIDEMKTFFKKVFSEVGINNVVQVITSSQNSAFAEEIKTELSEKYRQIFWSVSGSSCMQLMLEKLEKMDIIKETLEKAKIITRFIYNNPKALKYLKDKIDGRDLFQQNSKIKSTQPFLTLENIVFERKILTEMFLSADFDRKVAEIVADESFWSGASIVLKAAIPLVRVMEWMVKGSNKDQSGYIYETIDQAKETIEGALENNEPECKRFWEVIDDIWTGTLYSPLHAAGYYLNPNLFYTSEMFIDPEVTTGLLCCVVRTTRDPRVQDRVTIQMETYQNARGAFELGWPEHKRSNISPAKWWSRYGGECPELQKLAIRVLSQTCDGASKFQLNRASVEKLLERGMSRRERKRMADSVFVEYNMQLQNFGSGYIVPHEIEPPDDWIIYRGRNDGAVWMDLDGESTTDGGVIDFGGPSDFRKKVDPV